MGSNPSQLIKNNRYLMVSVIFWQRMRDSNPRKRSQSPVCYRYTNPLYLERSYYIHIFRIVKAQRQYMSVSTIFYELQRYY